MKIENLDLKKAKKIIIEWAKSKSFITKVYFFGSRISGYSKKTGEPVRPDSDLDVAIEFNQLTNNEDCFTTWTCDAKKWKNEIVDLLGFEKVEHLDLQWYHLEETEHIDQYLKDCSVVIFSSSDENMSSQLFMGRIICKIVFFVV